MEKRGENGAEGGAGRPEKILSGAGRGDLKISGAGRPKILRGAGRNGPPFADPWLGPQILSEADVWAERDFCDQTAFLLNAFPRLT